MIARWSALLRHSGHTGLAGNAWALFMCGFAALGLIWMPLVLLRQLDAYIAFLTPLELARDASLAYVLLIIPAAFLALLAVGSRRLLMASGLSRPSGAMLAWSLAILPVLWVCLWQLASSARAWLAAVSTWNLSVTAPVRLLIMALMLGGLTLLIRRFGLSRCLNAIITRMQALQRPAQIVFVLALLCIAVKPPRILWGTPAPTPIAVSAEATAKQPDIFLITIDTLAAADANVCGQGPTLMPMLREFAQRASCFSQHYSSSNFTTPGTSTLETGALPWKHWAVQIVSPIAQPLQAGNLAASLRQAGYETHSINANLMASPRHHGTYPAYDSHLIADSKSWGNVPRELLSLFADTTLPYWFSGIVPFLDTMDVYRLRDQHPFAPEYAYKAMLSRLDAKKTTARRPQFIWVHTLPPHDPYLPPPATKYHLLPKGELENWSEFLGMGSYAGTQQPQIDKYRLRYQESIMGADAALGDLMKQLQVRGRLENALVIVSSDHGESFEKGFLGHAGELVHNAVLQVPLVIRLPGQLQGRQINTPVSLADVAPTIADVARAAPLPAADGRSLRPALEGAQMEPRPVFAMAMERQSRFQPLRAGHYAMIRGEYKLVLHLAQGRSELFNLQKDPLERVDLSASEPATAALRQELEAALAQAEQGRKSLFAKP